MARCARDCGCGRHKPSAGNKGKRFTAEHRLKLSRALKGRTFEPNSKIFSVEYRARRSAMQTLPWEQKSNTAKHVWVRTNWEDPGFCEKCGSTRKLEWANIGHAYRQVREEWQRLCRTCHKGMDAADRRAKRHAIAEERNIAVWLLAEMNWNIAIASLLYGR